MKKVILFFLRYSLHFLAPLPRVRHPLSRYQKRFQEKNESFVLDANVAIHFNDPSLANEAHFLQKKIFDVKGLFLPMGKGT